MNEEAAAVLSFKKHTERYFAVEIRRSLYFGHLSLVNSVSLFIISACPAVIYTYM